MVKSQHVASAPMRGLSVSIKKATGRKRQTRVKRVPR